MPQITLSGIVRRRFVHCVNQSDRSVRDLVGHIGLSPTVLCKIIADQNTAEIPLWAFYRIARWLQMPLINVIRIGGKQPKISELVTLGMKVRGYSSSSTEDQERAAQEVGVSVAVFRRALHGYASFRPSIRTCQRIADWLSWTRFDQDDIAVAAGMLIHYQSDGKSVIVSSQAARSVRPYPCACGRAGCIIPAHIPNGPHRKWRDDACRMWATRRLERKGRRERSENRSMPALLQHSSVRFIMINERAIPVRF